MVRLEQLPNVLDCTASTVAAKEWRMGFARMSSRRAPKPSKRCTPAPPNERRRSSAKANRIDNILPASETHRRSTARLGLGDRRPLASVGKESHQSRGRPRKRGLPRPVRHPSPVPRAKTGCLWLGPRARLRLMAGAGSRQIR